MPISNNLSNNIFVTHCTVLVLYLFSKEYLLYSTVLDYGPLRLLTRAPFVEKD